ncbi:alpha/beta hydrolase-fold protein [Phycicoccus ginsengisoli]
MPLLGWPLLVTLGVVVGTAMALAVLLWSRVRGPRPLRVTQRVGLLVLTQVTTVLLVAAALNNYGYFYGSWSDLLGTSSAGAPSARTISRALAAHGRTGAPLAVTRDATVAGESTWSAPAQWRTKGRVESLTVYGAHSRLSEQTLVYLPPQYFQPAYAKSRFPAVEVFTGYPGTTSNLVRRMHYPDVLLKEIQAGRSRPMVLVMLRPTVAPPRDTECTDVPAGPQTLTYFAEDVPRAISSSLRVQQAGWGAMGDSTGGYCATKIAMTHSSVFPVAASLSGYYHTLRDGTTGDLWGGSPQVRELNDLEWLLRHQPAPPVWVYASIGADEHTHTGVGDTRAFAALVRPPMSMTTVVLPGGGHNFRSWSQVMPAALDFLSHHLA